MTPTEQALEDARAHMRDGLDARPHPNWTNIARALLALADENERLEKLVYVPGLWKCAKCKCVVMTNTLHVPYGAMSANNSPQQCPNDCGPMWRVTERAAGNEVVDRMDAQAERLKDLDRALNERDLFINPDAMDQAADEIDCGGATDGCGHCWQEWDTGAGGCRKSERGDYCPNDVAETLRALAKVARRATQSLRSGE